jgi:hypothetical protein
MTSTAKGRTCPTPAARQKQVWDKAAPGYDKQIAFFEKTWFAGGREWLGERALGRVLEVAIGTGRNLPCYPADVTITGIELSPRCWQSAGSAPPTSAVTLTCAKATPSTCQSRTPHSTPSSARCRCAPYPAPTPRSARCGESLPRRAASAAGPYRQHLAAGLRPPVALGAFHDPHGRGALHPPPAAPGPGGRVPGRGERTAQGRHRGAHPRSQTRLTLSVQARITAAGTLYGAGSVPATSRCGIPQLSVVPAGRLGSAGPRQGTSVSTDALTSRNHGSCRQLSPTPSTPMALRPRQASIPLPTTPTPSPCCASDILGKVV